MHHRPRSWHKIGLAYVMTRFFFLHHATNESCQLVIRSAPSHLTVQIVIPN
jgi:hypothetical protein